MRFVNSLWLLALGAMAWPVVFHLIRRQRFERMEIATLRFLIEAVQERRSFRRVENWPLLLVRALAVAALAFLLARPFLASSEPLRLGNAAAIVLADVSGSQARADLAGTARKWIDDLPPGSTLTVARFADDVETLKSVADLHAVPGTATDFRRAVDWTFARLAQSNAPAARVLIVSDFPRESLRPLTPRLWPPNAEITLLQTGAREPWNAGIERVELLTPVAAAELDVEVVVKISGPAPSGPLRVRLLADGQKPLEQKLAAGQSRARFHWPANLPAEGLLVRGFAEVVAEDAVPADNRRPFAFPAVRQRAVLLIDGEPGDSAFSGAAYFVEKALSATSAEREVPQFRSVVRLAPGDLAGFDVVALCNVASLADRDAAVLGAFVAKGGGLLVSAGAHTPPAVFAMLGSAGIDFGKLTAAASPALHRSRIIDAAHPALPAPREEFADSWRQLEFWHAFDFQTAATAKTLLAFDDTAPLLIEAAVAGRALAFLHPLNRERSEFSREPLFVPWTREIFRHLARAGAPPWRVREIPMSLAEPRPAGIYGEGADI